MSFSAPRSTRLWTVVLLAGLLSACAQLPANSQRSAADPWERMNRGTHQFNNSVDRAVLKPVATAYRDHVPEPIRTSVTNVLDNLGYPTTIANQFLQGKLKEGLQDTGRFLLNTTFGVAGIFDLASRAGLDKHDEDLGQTLGRWGMPSGPYLVIPLLGPSTVRDTPTRYVDSRTAADQLLDDEVRLFRKDAWEYGRPAISVLDTRAGLLQLDRLRDQAFDEYVFVRDAWMQRREYAVQDGDVEEAPIEIYSDEETGANEDSAPEASDAEPRAPEVNPSGSVPPPKPDSPKP